ncbi:unnamed protein product [Schistocephalus solidus]|uniref:Uncharacterized protein n=1 Tax=Schistocephalus solidus TaxID=70667 RepID=A0A183SDJ1_SCHSO|nr:unnamed protein product [Schistocephalus solidus]
MNTATVTPTSNLTTTTIPTTGDQILDTSPSSSNGLILPGITTVAITADITDTASLTPTSTETTSDAHHQYCGIDFYLSSLRPHIQITCNSIAQRIANQYLQNQHMAKIVASTALTHKFAAWAYSVTYAYTKVESTTMLAHLMRFPIYQRLYPSSPMSATASTRSPTSAESAHPYPSSCPFRTKEQHVSSWSVIWESITQKSATQGQKHQHSPTPPTSSLCTVNTRSHTAWAY